MSINQQLLRQIRSAAHMMSQKDGFGKLCFPKHLEYTKVVPGEVEAEFVVEEKHTNLGGSLHGGFIATMIDIGGTLAIVSKGANEFGVSTDIHTSYLSGAKVGEKVRMWAKCHRLGKRMAFTTAKIYKMDNEGNEVIIATGSHSKYLKAGSSTTESPKL